MNTGLRNSFLPKLLQNEKQSDNLILLDPRKVTRLFCCTEFGQLQSKQILPIEFIRGLARYVTLQVPLFIVVDLAVFVTKRTALRRIGFVLFLSPTLHPHAIVTNLNDFE